VSKVQPKTSASKHTSIREGDIANDTFGQHQYRNSFEGRLQQQQQDSPRTTFQRAREQSIRDLNESILNSAKKSDTQQQQRTLSDEA